MAQQHEDQASPFATWYDRIVLCYPAAVVLLYLVGFLFFAYQLQFFRMDASSDSLVLENDADLKYYNNTREIFGSDDYIIVALSHDRSVLSDNVLANVEGIAKELGSLEAVSSVQSILSVPLFHSPKVSLFEMGSKYQTLLMEDTDRRLAFEELTQSPLFSNNLISSDGKTTAIIVTFKPDLEYNQLRDERFELRQRRAEGTWTEEERLRLDEVSSLYNTRHAKLSGQRRDDVGRIRGILANYRDQGYQLAESGLPVIVADMVSYIERDILVFGIAVIVFLAIVLSFLFRQTRWVLLPLSTCSITVVFMMGYLGLTGWETTVVTSNFSSLLLIVSMAYAMHLTVRYREIHARSPERGHREILLEAVRRISVPTFYTSATTVVRLSNSDREWYTPRDGFWISDGVWSRGGLRRELHLLSRRDSLVPQRPSAAGEVCPAGTVACTAVGLVHAGEPTADPDCGCCTVPHSGLRNDQAQSRESFS